MPKPGPDHNPLNSTGPVQSLQKRSGLRSSESEHAVVNMVYMMFNQIVIKRLIVDRKEKRPLRVEDQETRRGWGPSNQIKSAARRRGWLPRTNVRNCKD